VTVFDPNFPELNPDKVGRKGGYCQCPDGKMYQVGAYNDICMTLACVNGTGGACFHFQGMWSYTRVICRNVESETPYKPHSSFGEEDSHWRNPKIEDVYADIYNGYKKEITVELTHEKIYFHQAANSDHHASPLRLDHLQINQMKFTIDHKRGENAHSDAKIEFSGILFTNGETITLTNSVITKNGRIRLKGEFNDENLFPTNGEVPESRVSLLSDEYSSVGVFETDVYGTKLAMRFHHKILELDFSHFVYTNNLSLESARGNVHQIWVQSYQILNLGFVRNPEGDMVKFESRLPWYPFIGYEDVDTGVTINLLFPARV
jgi:hypothetical protein